MTVFQLIAILTTVTALAAWVNYRFVHLPTTIGVMVLALVGSLLIVLGGRLGVADTTGLTSFVAAISFDDALLDGMLGALLFAGALHIDIGRLRASGTLIMVLATGGVLLSTGIVGVAGHFLLALAGVDIPLMWMIIFGAVIAPTDPIAVGAILRKAGVPQQIETLISGESLFNDGVGVVVFVLLLKVMQGAHVGAPAIATLVAREVVGGLACGAVLGWVAFRMLRAVDNYTVEILLTLAVATGGYALAHAMHVSGPLAMVVAGLMTGNSGRRLAMSGQTIARLDAFWELVDDFLNAALFVLIGLEVVVLELSIRVLIAGATAIPLVLAARFISVGVPLSLLRAGRALPTGAVRIMTWGGLRGGISVALALSLPPSAFRAPLVAMTYMIVCFSIIVQGLTIGRYARRHLVAA